MASIYIQDMPWHDGEAAVRKSMRAPDTDNPTVPTMSAQLANHLQVAPLIAIGTLDKEGRPWTTLWGNGDKGFAQPMGAGIIGIKTPVAGKYDPVVEELVGKEANGTIIREEGKGRMVSGLTIDLETRKRVKMFGRMAAGALGEREDEVVGTTEHVAEIQLVLKIEQSLGNCPKYLNKKHIVTAASKPELVSDSIKLVPRALELVDKADLFFISSHQGDVDMDTNHRGGPQGFVRVISNDESGAVIAYPEYSGNRLYQTLGNLQINPVAGICIPDFDTGDMLYLSGTTSILVGTDAAAVLPRSNLAVTLKVTSARLVASALPFRGIPGDRSPYNPSVRYLTTERTPATAQSAKSQIATLLSQTTLTPNISRFRFALQNAASYKPGQYVTLDFSETLDMGYSHMRDDDPLSINDDFVRTFTVSSLPGTPPDPTKRLKDDEFEITIRKVGAVTGHLFRYQGKEGKGRGMRELEIGVKGFGGEFEVRHKGEEERIAFVAAGVGITPILPSLYTLDLRRLTLIWAVRKADLSLVRDVLEQHPRLAGSLRVFVSDANDEEEEAVKMRAKGVEVNARRVTKADVQLEGVQRVYLCAAVPMRKILTEWMPGKELIFEDFNF